MGFTFDGHVLRAPLLAPGNAATSGEPINGVVRDVRRPPATRNAAQPQVSGMPGIRALVDLCGDQYRAAVLHAPGTSPHEYLVWAANSSQLALVSDPSWWTNLGTGSIPVGTETVGNLVTPTAPYKDGTLRLVVADNGDREISTITHLVVARGDKTYNDLGWVNQDNPAAGRLGTAPYEVVAPAAADQNGTSGLVTLKNYNVYTATGSGLTAGTLAAVLGGGLSLKRGDKIQEVRYTVAPLKFWWTRNDRYETRFGWDGKLQRWKPYKGSAPVNLGKLAYDTAYTLKPKMRTLPLGAILTGDASSPDEYAMVRLGTSPGAQSLPVGLHDPDGFTGIEVVADADVGPYDFSGKILAGVVGQNSGILKFNPVYAQKNVGKVVWYVYSTFSAEADGVLGPLQGADTNPLYLAPIPGPTDHPFIRIQNRTPLTVTQVDTEADLVAVADPMEGTCLVAQSTGRLRLSPTDIAKANPKNLSQFSKHFLGASVIYEGVALNARPQPTRSPVPLVQADGVTTTLAPVAPMYLPRSQVWPEDIEGTSLESYMGLGVSGVLQMPDGTGAVPTPELVDPAGVSVPVRPGGDTLFPSPQSLGLVLTIADGVGDTILFSQAGAIPEVLVVDRQSDVPLLPFQVPGGKAYISKQIQPLPVIGWGAKVQLGSADRTAFVGKKVYFLQASLNPATYTDKARLYSKGRIIFRFDGTEVLYFAIGGVIHDWHASSLPSQSFYSADEVAASIQARITAQGGTGLATAVGDRICLETVNPNTGTVEIGWGTVKDLSGCAALGFLPGWRAKGGKPNWLSDAGISLGLSRSLLNLDRSKATSDYRARTRLENVTLADSIQSSPFTFLDYPPVEDISGFDDGVFFNLQTVSTQGADVQLIDKRLEHFEDIQYRFPEGKFAWLEQEVSSNQVQQKTTALALGRAAVVPETLLGAPGIGGGLFTAESGGRYAFQEQGVDYILPDDGLPGVAQLVTRYGALVLTGAQGAFTQGGTTFTDPTADFLADSTDPDIDPATGQQRIDNLGDLVWLPVLREGFRIKLPSGSYLVTAVTDATHAEVTPAFVSSSTRPTPWEAYIGIADSLYDPAIVADVTYKPFDHLQDEPFKVRVLSPLGTIAGSDFSAFVADAVAKGRLISLRFGPVHASTGVMATLTPLAVTSLGVVANNVLVAPWTVHVAEGAFQIRVGTETYTPVPVMSFSPNPVGVEYLTGAWNDGVTVHPQGELKFAASVLSDLQSSQVVLAETLRVSTNLASGQAEYDPKTGALRIAAADVSTHAGKMLYFVEQMITKGVYRDVGVSPLVGAVSFTKPMSPGALVEMVYWLADTEGRRVGTPTDTVTEFLPVFVRGEVATRLSDREFELDPNGVQVWDDRMEPVVYIGPTQQNFGTVDFTTDRPGNLKGLRLNFNRAMATWIDPVATYAVFNAQGGERTYSTSQSPVYRPPFFIQAKRDNFGLRGDRTADFVPGQMLRLGAECFYLTQIRYFAPTDQTRIDIYPPTTLEVGSRSPGNDVLALITSVPITTMLYPDGPTPVPTTAKAGFMQVVPTTTFPFEPVNARQASMTFRGDLSQFAVPGHIMEIGGKPFTIAQVTLNDDGTRTQLAFTTAFQQAVDPAGTTIKLSYRPVYPPEVREFVGKGPVVASEGTELILFGETIGGIEQPGRSLAEGTEFSLDSETGVVQLLGPLQAPLGPGQRLVLAFTQMRVLEPFFSGGTVVFPRWSANYRYNTIPSNDNGFLGGRLTATYTFDNPDTFYFRALPLKSYLGEALTQALAEMSQGQPSSGPRLTTTAGTQNWEQGNTGLLAQQRDLFQKDRAARAFLSFYNDTIVAFEQVDETITGEFIGDRSGKFRFFVGRGLEYAPPGYEDEITGDLNPNNIWAQVFNEADPTRNITFLAGKDPLVIPVSCTMTNLLLSGPPLGVSTLGHLQYQQVLRVRNDVDDVLLLQASKPRKVTTSAPPYFTVQNGGIYSRMGLPHKFSRLYPTTAGVFFTLQPGIEADLAAGNVGTYAYSKVNSTTGKAESTHNEQVGQVANPVRGDIEAISVSTLRPRAARARIWGYYPNGLPTAAFGTAIARPCMVLSAVPLAQLPISPLTGFPDPTKFLSQSPTGTVPDAVAGDPEMALPGFKAGDKIALGRPDGSFLVAAYPEEVDVFGQKMFTAVLIDTVQFGCVVTFKNRKGAAILSPSKILVATAPNEGTPADQFGIDKADTLYIVPADTANPISDPATQSATMAMAQQAAATSPAYRQGFDLTVRPDGRVMDQSLPSWTDPFMFPVKEILGQKSPKPMSHVEGVADFANMDEVPIEFPALQGAAQDDSGDYQIPYRKGTATEIDRFDELGNLLGSLMARDVLAGGYYPDEILFTNGEVLAAAVSLGGGSYKEPATLMAQANVLPTATYGAAPARPGDFVLVDVGGAEPGWQGILSVGAVREQNIGGTDWSWIEPPRFRTQTNKGSPSQYLLNNYAVHTTPGNYPVNPQVTNPPGVRIFDDSAGVKTILSFQDTVLALNDGSVLSTGNLNAILAADPANALVVKILSRPDGTAVNAPAGPGTFVPALQDGRPLLTIHITGAAVVFTPDPALGAPVGVAHLGVQVGTFDPVTGEVPPGTVADSRHIIIDGVTGLAFFNAAFFGANSDWFLPFTVAGTLQSSAYGWEYALDVDCTAGGSTSAFIGSDRLTFHEALDLRLSRPRDFMLTNPNPPGYNYETGLDVTGVTVALGSPPAPPVFSGINDVAPGALSFVSRTGSTTLAGGTWAPAPTPADEGTLRVMAFEYGNTPITASNIVASVQASQTVDPAGGDILTGNGVALQNWISAITPTAGLVSQVLKGDVVYIDRADLAHPDAATEKAGTYVVRHAVEPDGVLAYKAVSVSAPVGSGGGFIATRFPRVLSIDVAGSRLALDDYSMLPATGKVFIVVSYSGLNSSVAGIFQKALMSIDFTGLDGLGLILGAANTWRWADDSIIVAPLTEVTNTMVAGQLCSWHDTPVAGAGPSLPGRMTLKVAVRGGQLPDDSSVVGYHDSPAVATYGFNALTLENYGPTSIVAPNILMGAPAVGQAQVTPATVWASGTFDPTNAEAVYADVPATLVLYLTNLQGTTLNDPQNHLGGGPGVACLLPNTEVRTETAGGLPGFFARGGVFIEPSVPNQPDILGALAVPKVVDASHSLLLAQVGMRSAATAEEVHFEVRRVRRWHSKQNALNDAFQPLKYAYEIRRGTITGFSRDAQQVGLVTAASGTNLGGFDSEDVNIHAGDIFRVTDALGTVLADGVISEVVSATQIKIAAPGLAVAAATVVGRSFEVYLRQSPCPHEQSNEQLLALITDKVVHRTWADRTDPDPQNWTGGYVPETDGTANWVDVCNVLYDDSPGVNFTALGVKRDDIVVIDPVGVFPAPVVDERGFRPLGDRSVPTRTAAVGPTPYLPGAVSSLDDNRGFYRVTVVHADHLEVTPLHTFAGGLGTDVLMASGKTNLVYAVYPTVSSSVLSVDGAEGQNDLRPTRKAVGTTYTSMDPVEDKHSIRPFSYFIIRPTTMFSKALVDTVLLMRERMLSLIEMLGTVTSGARGGFYWDWQNDEHISDLGDPLDPESGLGLFPNRLVVGLLGETGISPFCNNSTCLSLLDRRFWVHDVRLDSLAPDPSNPYAMVTAVLPFDQPGGPYTAYTDTATLTGGSEVRPVLTDHLDLILNVRDRLRGIRYTWLTYRTNRFRGTLARIDQYNAALPKLLADRQRALLLEASVGKVST